MAISPPGSAAAGLMLSILGVVVMFAFNGCGALC
jgi:hypothetical protein